MVGLDYESNYINAFKPLTRVVQDYRFTEDRLGGIGVVSLVVPAGDRLNLTALKAHGELESRVSALERDGQPAIAQVLSLASVLDPEGKIARLPEAKANEVLQAKLDLIASSPQGNLLRGFWSPKRPDAPDSGWARLVIRVSEQQPALEKEKTFLEALGLASAMEEFGPSSFVTGLSYLLTQTTRGVIASSWITFLWSAAGILIMLTLAFGGVRLAALAILPTLLSVALVLGLTGWMGVKLDIATALVASVALGLSVDDTFHCLLQFRRHRTTEPFRESLMASYFVTGPGVVLSSLAVAVGFAVLRFSEFVPFSNFGTMVGVATLGSSLGNLVLLPACLALGHRWWSGHEGETRNESATASMQVAGGSAGPDADGSTD